MFTVYKEVKMKLSEETKTKMRKIIEDEFKKVPEGIKVKLDIEMMDELIFYYGYLKDEGDIDYKRFKVPIWTPDCLSKIDLSELSFKNIWLDNDEISYDIFDSETEKQYEENGFPYVLNREERKKYPNMAFINFKNTNINIDFRDAAFGKRLYYWNLSGVDLSESHIDSLFAIENCDLSNTNINIDNVDWFIKPAADDWNMPADGSFCEIFGDNFSGNNLSKVRLNIENIISNNFANTGLRIYYSEGKFDESIEELLRDSLKRGYLVGCYLNNVLIKENDTLEDVLNRANSQEQELLNSLSETIKGQIPIVQGETDLETKKHI